MPDGNRTSYSYYPFVMVVFVNWAGERSLEDRVQFLYNNGDIDRGQMAYTSEEWADTLIRTMVVRGKRMVLDKEMP